MGRCFSVPIERTFHDDFTHLVHKLNEKKSFSFQKQAVENFLTSWTITLENISQEFDHSSALIKIPIELTEKRLTLTLNSYMKSEEFNEKALNFALQIIKRTLPILQEKTHNEKELDKDLYAFIIASLENIFENQNKRFALSSMISSITLKKEDDDFFYETIENSPILAEAISTISRLLNWLKNSPIRLDVLKDYPGYIEQDIIGEFLAILPQKVMVIHDYFLPEIYGTSLSTEKIILRRGLLDETEGKREIKIAKTMMVILHEMENLKSKRFYTGNKYLGIAEEKNFDKEKEGFYIEEDLFGGVLDLAKIDLETAKLILDIENFQNLERYEMLKMKVGAFLCEKSGGIHLIKSGRDIDEEYQRCKVHRLGLEHLMNFEKAKGEGEILEK